MSGKFKFFQGQGIVREFCDVSGKNEIMQKCQGYVGEFTFQPDEAGVFGPDVSFYTPPHNNGGVLWFHVGRPCIRPSSLRPSVFRFRMIT